MDDHASTVTTTSGGVRGHTSVVACMEDNLVRVVVVGTRHGCVSELITSMFGLDMLEGERDRVLGDVDYVHLAQHARRDLLAILVPLNLSKDNNQQDLSISSPSGNTHLNRWITFDNRAQEIIALRLVQRLGKLEWLNHRTNWGKKQKKRN